MKTETLSLELLHKMNAYWRAANYLSFNSIIGYLTVMLINMVDVSNVPI